MANQVIVLRTKGLHKKLVLAEGDKLEVACFEDDGEAVFLVGDLFVRPGDILQVYAEDSK